jgi:hypothetical protein
MRHQKSLYVWVDVGSTGHLTRYGFGVARSDARMRLLDASLVAAIGHHADLAAESTRRVRCAITTSGPCTSDPARSE